MKNKLEQLLNSLVKVWWKPYWISRVKNVTLLNRYVSFSKRTILWIEFFEYTLRSLASKESWLWQFVCENWMIKKKWEYRAKRRHLHWWEHDEDVYHDISYTKNDYEYYIIESALKDESELEDFLLSNIKVEW